ncbi:DoxX family protein [Myxococcaceae bacterium JPH2]|nr:DoxX family protein [Myxococcaceae bacterium JPH2]
MSRTDSFLAPTVAPAAAAALLRGALGAVFLAHAYAKLFLFTLPGTAQFFEAHGFPGWTAYPVFIVELLGGLALLAGFRTRWVALGLIPVMLGALKPHLGNGWMFSSAGGGWEYVAFLIVALAAQALLGSGLYSLDAMAGKTSAAPRTA